MSIAKADNFGRVYLVGAGPGDAGLITVRGLTLLRRADVVIYDALVNRALLDEAPASAVKIDAGKRAKEHTLTQDQTNNLLVEHARQGKIVVRLKGGDPYLFGRGAEEAIYVAQHGVPVEVVPGVTSGIAAPAYAGIAVTHRQYASSVTFVTAHEDPRKFQSSTPSSDESGDAGSFVDYQALAQLVKAGGTLCLYMGVGRLSCLVQTFMGYGLNGDTPAAVVQWGTTPKQKQVRSTLMNLAVSVEQAGIAAPAMIVIGAVAGVHEPGLDFFLKKPLLGQRIIITRTRSQSSQLRLLLEEQGALVLEAPTIERVEPTTDDLAQFDAAMHQLQNYHWLVLTSVGGVEALAQRLALLQLDARVLGAVKLAAVGDSTAAALWDHLRLRADLVPTQFDGDSLAQALAAHGAVRGQRMLLLRADLSREDLPKLLTEAGAEVTCITAYHTRITSQLPDEVLQALRHGEVDWVTFTSGSTARNLVQLLGEERGVLTLLKTASIGPVTSAAMRELGIEPTLEAQVHDVPGLVAAMVDFMSQSVQQQQQ